MVFDPLVELRENPGVMKMPVVRNGTRATVGYDPGEWEAWIAEERS